MKRFISLFVVAVVICTSFCCVFFSCSRNDIDKNRSPYAEFTDTVDVEMMEYLDQIQPEDLTESDLTLENGNHVIDVIKAYDTEFWEENPWLLEFEDIYTPSEEDGDGTRVATRAGGGISGNAGIVNLKNTVISQMIMGGAFFLNNSRGEAANQEVRRLVADKDQVGLWFKWGGKQWDDYSYPSKGGEPVDGDDLKCYGLDGSGLVYSAMNKIGLEIPVQKANDYYNVDLWNNALQPFLVNKKLFPEDIKYKLSFEKYEYSNTEIVKKVQPGDILFWGPLHGHMGIVSTGGKIAQSNGMQHPDNAKENASSNRGPHLISVSNASVIDWWGAAKFGVIRLVATLNNTHWRLNIKCEGKDTYITSFDIEINMSEGTTGEIEIEPVQTIGHDYSGEQCDVYFTGSYNPETQVLKGSVKKTYPSSTRTDGFEVKLTDDDIRNIHEYKIVSNGACTNYLDLENLDNKTRASSNRPVVNTATPAFPNVRCSDIGY